MIDISDDNKIKVDIDEFMEKALDANHRNVTIPTVDLQALFPNVDFSPFYSINLTTEDPRNPFNGYNVSDFIKSHGNISLPLNEVFRIIQIENYTKIELPIDTLLDTLLNLDIVPTSLAHNFTLIDSFDEVHGKVADSLGNVALIDCKYANRLFQTTYNKVLRHLVKT
jgi:hypothetical protein